MQMSRKMILLRSGKFPAKITASKIVESMLAGAAVNAIWFHLKRCPNDITAFLITSGFNKNVPINFQIKPGNSTIHIDSIL